MAGGAAGGEAHPALPAPPARAPGALVGFACSSAAVVGATMVTNPLDVLKVRLQAPGSPPGLWAAGAAVVREGGLAGLTRGLAPAAARAATYGGLRLGLYTPLREGLGTLQPPPPLDPSAPPSGRGGSPNLGAKLVAGVLAGAAAQAATNPLEVAKVRLQGPGAPTGAGASLLGLLGGAARAEGVGVLWKGCGPAVVRAAVLTASQCASYDEAKRVWKDLTGSGECFSTHLGASMLSGLLATAVTTPVDVLKTRMQLERGSSRSALQHAGAVLSAHGVAGLWRGFSASYLRLGPQTALIFVLCEALRSAAGLPQL